MSNEEKENLEVLSRREFLRLGRAVLRTSLWFGYLSWVGSAMDSRVKNVMAQIKFEENKFKPNQVGYYAEDIVKSASIIASVENCDMLTVKSTGLFFIGDGLVGRLVRNINVWSNQDIGLL